MKIKAAMFWSGGKDSAFALHKVLTEHKNLDVHCLVTTINEEYQRISMHGVRDELLRVQAKSIGIPLFEMVVANEPTNASYEKALDHTFVELKKEGVTHIIYGDIFLEDLKVYRDSILAQYDLIGVYPLWKQITSELIHVFLESGFKTITCCINTLYLGEEWLGRVIDNTFVAELGPQVDPCGENGEFHTFCFEGPVFKYPVKYKLGKKEYRPLSIKTDIQVETSGFWYIDLIPT